MWAIGAHNSYNHIGVTEVLINEHNDIWEYHPRQTGGTKWLALASDGGKLALIHWGDEPPTEETVHRLTIGLNWGDGPKRGCLKFIGPMQETLAVKLHVAMAVTDRKTFNRLMRKHFISVKHVHLAGRAD